jgi:RHS repeat-associated protein
LSNIFGRSLGPMTFWRSPLLSWTRRLALSLPVVLATSLVGVPNAVAHAAAKPAAASCPASAADEMAALITARVCGGRVSIDDATTETVTAVALPSGQVERTISAAPVRVKQNGRWVGVDLTLVRNADGTVSPKAAPSDLVLSGTQPGSAVHALATAGIGERRVSMGWTGKLAEPILDGDRATYPEVRDGIDLVVQATRTGAETFFVVKSREAAGRMDGLNLPVTGAKVTSSRIDADGNTVLLSSAGAPVAAVPAPLMWDARVDPSNGTPLAVRKVPARVSKKAARVTKPRKALDGAGTQLKLYADEEFFDAPDTQYPVTVDPQVNPLYTTFDTYVKEGDTVDRSGANDLQLGIVSGAKARSFVHWDTSKLVGKQITSATVHFWNWWSESCTGTTWDIWSTGAASADTRWSSQPAWKTKEASSTAAAGGASCANGWVSANGTSFFQRAATAGQSRGYMGIRAANETDGTQFKQFRSRNAADNNQVPYAVVNYNSYPVVDARATSPSTSCVTGAGRPYIGSATPTLKATISDTEASPVKGIFEWYSGSGAKIGGNTTALAASGSTVSTTVPAGAFVNGSSYSWRVQGNDGAVNGAWSSSCEFTVDTTAPPSGPTVSSLTYPAGAPGGNAGTAGTFTFSANGVTDVAAFLYGLDVSPPTTIANATTLGGNASVSITPASAGNHTLYVRSRDRGGNLSPITSYAFTVDSKVGEVILPEGGDLTAGRTVLAGMGTATSTGVTYQWRRAETDTWTTVPAADVATGSGAAVTWPVATTGGGRFPNLTWNVEATVNAAEAGPDALDGPLQLRASFTGGTPGTAAPVRFSLDRDRAAAAAYDLGPGSVNLLTGDLAVSVSDAEFGQGLGLQRTYHTRQAGGTDGMFGPGWSSATTVSTADDYGTLTVVGSLAQVSVPGGSTLGFTKKASTSTGATFDAQVGAEDLTLEYRSGDNSYRLSDEAATTIFTRKATDPAGVYSPTSAIALGNLDTTATSWEKATVDGVEVVRPTRIIDPAPTGVNCADAPLTTAGCRTLTFTYATATTAGDYTGRLSKIDLITWDPASTAMKTVTVSRYGYDSAGRLSAQWDPRLDYTATSGALAHQAITYGYNADGILSTVTPPGEQPWSIDYTTVPGDSGKGRMAKISRSALSAGTATTTLVYRVPTAGATAPADLSAAQATRWGQTITPVDATAVFPPTQVPGGNQATGTLPTSWQQATVHYLDANGRETNTLEPGKHLSSTWYDRYGNTIRELAAGNRERALNLNANDTAAAEAEVAERLSSVTTYSDDGRRTIDVLGPEYDIMLSKSEDFPDGTTGRGRAHTTYRYAEGAPEGHTSNNLVTTKTTGIQYWNDAGQAVDGEVRKVVTDYDWNLLQPTSTTVDPDGVKLTTRYTYDSDGRQSSTTTPAGTGLTAATRTTAYYRADTGSGYEECDNHPEWADMVCRTGPAANADNDPELPAQVTRYNMYGQATTTTETNSTGVLRVVTIGYDTAGRTTTTDVSAAAGAGEAVSARRVVYDPATSSPVRTQTLNASGQVTAEIIRTFDTLGRVTSYIDATGSTSTFTYDIAGRRQTISDGKSTATTTYDDPEGRGLASQLVDGQAGTFTATYDADGRIATENRPNGVTVSYGYNEEGTLVSLRYLAGSTPILSSRAGVAAEQQRTRTWSDVSNATYTYDRAGRLAMAEQNVRGACQTREYGINKASNRTGLTVYLPNSHGECDAQQDEPAIERSWQYDDADRLIGTGYSYDDLGRTLTVAAQDTYAGATGGNAALTYYSNDMTRTISQGGSTTTQALDVVPNRYGSSTKTGSSPFNRINHFSDDSDSPSWIADAAGYTRIISGLGGLAATYTGSVGHLEWQFTDLHGDIIAVSLNGSSTLTATFAYDEFGNPVDSAPNRYGYVGSEQRVGDNDGGFMTMGVRTYNPVTGRFLSVDPKYGGSCNPYDYVCADPVNEKDPTGLCPVCVIPAAVVDALVIVIGAIIIGMILYYMIKARSSLVAIPGTTVRVPFPSIWARSTVRFMHTLYHVYEIYRIYPYRTWKYGITRQVAWWNRPAGQLSKCRKYYHGASCSYYSIMAVHGWYRARFAEALLFSAYALRHGRCPDGAPFCI